MTVQHSSEVCGFGAKGNGFVAVVDFQLTFGFLVVEVEDCQHCLCTADLINFQVWRYSPSVCFAPLRLFVPSPSACMIARSLAYAYFLETVADKSEI